MKRFKKNQLRKSENVHRSEAIHQAQALVPFEVRTELSHKIFSFVSLLLLGNIWRLFDDF